MFIPDEDVEDWRVRLPANDHGRSDPAGARAARVAADEACPTRQGALSYRAAGRECRRRAPITVYQAALIRDALERFGIEFTNGDELVKLTARKAHKSGK